MFPYGTLRKQFYFILSFVIEQLIHKHLFDKRL